MCVALLGSAKVNENAGSEPLPEAGVTATEGGPLDVVEPPPEGEDDPMATDAEAVRLSAPLAAVTVKPTVPLAALEVV